MHQKQYYRKGQEFETNVHGNSGKMAGRFRLFSNQ